MYNNLLHTSDQHLRSAQIKKYVGHTKQTRMVNSVNLLVDHKQKSICMTVKAKQDKAMSKTTIVNLQAYRLDCK